MYYCTYADIPFHIDTVCRPLYKGHIESSLFVLLKAEKGIRIIGKFTFSASKSALCREVISMVPSSLECSIIEVPL